MRVRAGLSTAPFPLPYRRNRREDTPARIAGEERLREYHGIDAYGGEVWTSFIGAVQTQPTDDESVVFGAWIDWAQ